MKYKYSNLNDWEKVEFLVKLEFSNEPDKWELIRDIIADRNEYDLARIEALKILEISDIPKSYKDKIAHSLLNILISEPDYDVRNYAACASINFMEYPDIEQLCIERLLDPSEDIDIRYCFFSSILKLADEDKICNILTKLLPDVEFSKNAKYNLDLIKSKQ